MGLSTVIKDMFTDDTSKNATMANTGSNVRHNDSTNAARDFRHGVQPDGAAQQTTGSHLKAGTGPGTTGKPAAAGVPESARVNFDQSRKLNDTTGMGTNSTNTKSATTAGTGAVGHQHHTGHVGSGFGSGNGLSDAGFARDADRRDARNESEFSRNTETVPAHHAFGHEGTDSHLTKPTGQVQEDSKHLASVVHENARHIETEEVSRVKDHERHVHHVQHHVQPVKDLQEREEVHHENIVPTAHVHENHVSTDKDVHAMTGLLGQHKDTITHAPKERHVIDNGETVRENVQHHVHHVVQPVIEKETIDRHRIHTVIPTHHVTHEAPIVHQSHHHEPMSMQQFTKLGHANEGLSHSDVTKQLLNQGECTREVDALGKNMSNNLRMEDGRGSTGLSGNSRDNNIIGDRSDSTLHNQKHAIGQHSGSQAPVSGGSIGMGGGQTVGANRVRGNTDGHLTNSRSGDML
ncbi:hypothetical protein PC9H_005613 [Pleurotus ostreatus]|uniref:Allergen n=1 Tax=Pleurotus ostreatus TaxID=5322 RepID=A0A8H6ZZV4_PLEOS|nr:uncharacterized protein PC9H_005613 [Pleurotus ostreatus]KAF7433651.1 hypothetical protein PC9H_005613 [Pleurotus ostreatus]KAJ8697605.1 hypothetical protein PTI98_004390 [Pleurotus ostreatus]